MLTTPASH